MSTSANLQEQLLLFRSRSDASFANFFVSAANAPIIHALREWLQFGTGAFYLYGASHSGKSHLLQAAAHANNFLYLPLAELQQHNPSDVLEGLDNFSGICFDDLHCVVADPAWCEQLFHLFNRMQSSAAKWLASAACASAQLSCALPDLQSRLRASGDFRLHALTDDECAHALQLRAGERGIALSEEVVAYILARKSRAFSALLSVLDQLDTQSLIEKKPITIPFVRRVLEHRS